MSTMTDPAPAICPVCGAATGRVVHHSRDWLVSRETFAIRECACGLRITDPAPAPATIGRYYDAEDYVGISGSRRGWTNRAYHLVARATVRWRARVAAAVAPAGRGRVVDVGCGRGALLAHLCRRGWEAWGVEPHARARAAARAAGITVLDVPEFLALDAPRFDVAMLWHALEHVHDPNATLARIAQLLVPGGGLVVACPNYGAFDAEYYGAEWGQYDPPRHLWHFRPEPMQRLLARHGFAPTVMRTVLVDPFYSALLSERHAPRGVTVLHPMAIGVRAMLAGLRDVRRSTTIVYLARRAAAGDGVRV